MADQKNDQAAAATQDASTRWRAAFNRGEWIVRDTWEPGSFCIGFKTEAEAEKEAKWRNGPQLRVVGADDGDREKYPWDEDDGDEFPFDEPSAPCGSKQHEGEGNETMPAPDEPSVAEALESLALAGAQIASAIIRLANAIEAHGKTASRRPHVEVTDELDRRPADRKEALDDDLSF